MKKLLTIGLLSCCMTMQAQEQFTYPLMGKMPYGFDTYGDVAYYHTGGKAYNLRGYKLSKVGTVVDFKINPSGSTYAVISEKGKQRSVTIYNLWKKNKVVKKLKIQKFTPVAVCYTSDAKTLLLAGNDANVYMFDAITGKSKGVAMNLNQVPTSISTSADGRFLAAVHGGSVEMWNIQDGVLRRELDAAGDIRSTDFSRDGKQFAVLTGNSQLAIYNTTSMEKAQTIDAMGSSIACSFHPEGKHIAVVTGTGRISVLNLLNDRERQYMEAPGEGINYMRFVKNSKRPSVYLAYNTDSQMVFENVDYLSPLRSKMIADRLQERMDEWERQLPGESMEDWQLRVNEQTRIEQMRLFEQDIANEMAMEEYGLAEMHMGAYNNETQMLAVGLGDGMPDIYLSVPEEDVAAFLEPNNLEFRNVKYGLNDKDEFELIYADVYNKATGKTYTYNNTEGQFLDYITDEATFTPLELVQQSILEEGSLAGLSENIVNEAKDQNLISDHTHISVKTNIRPAVDANGNNIRNYEVGVTYTVDQAYSAYEDYAAGKYKIEETNAGTAMLKIVKEALEKDFAKYVVEGKRLKVKISGTADASAIRKTIPYDGCYGDFNMQPIYLEGEMSNITVTKAEGIKNNEQLAFLRAVGVKEYLLREAASVNKMNTDVEYHISVSKETGSEHRKVSVEMIFEDAFDNN